FLRLLLLLLLILLILLRFLLLLVVLLLLLLLLVVLGLLLLALLFEQLVEFLQLDVVGINLQPVVHFFPGPRDVVREIGLRAAVKKLVRGQQRLRARHATGQ